VYNEDKDFVLEDDFMKTKKILAAIAALSIVCGAVSYQPFNSVTKNVVIAADAAEIAKTGLCGENVTYSFDSETGTLTISGTGIMSGSEGGSIFKYELPLTDIKCVIIEDGVTGIGGCDFEGCSNLESITIPDSVTSIGHSAFFECSSLTSIKIPDSVTSIGDFAFDYCENLQNIKLSASLTSIERYMFGKCSSLTSIKIPNSVTSIKEMAFDGCTNLSEITSSRLLAPFGDSNKISIPMFLKRPNSMASS